MKYIFLVLVFGLLSFSFLQGQSIKQARWEVENKFTQDSYSIVSLREDGLALIRDLEKWEAGKRKWELIILDTALREKWKTELDMHADMRFTGYEYASGKLYFMFRQNEVDILRAEMIKIDLATNEIVRSKTEIKLQIRLTHYTVVENNSVFGGYVGREPVLIIHDPEKNNNIIVPGFFLTDTELMDVRPNRNNTFNIVLFERVPAKKKIIFRTIDKLGNILVEDEIPVDEDKVILNAATSILQHDEVLVGGSFAYKNDKQASGIFSCLIDPFSEQPVRYVELHQLSHFLDYLPDKKARKVRSKASERSNYNKPLNFKTNVNIHRIEEFENGFALFGESFLATTSGSGGVASNPYSGAYRSYGAPYTYSPFTNRYYNNPYQFSPATVVGEMRMLQGFAIGFDFKGKRLWDYSIRMEELKVPGRDQIADFLVKENVPHFLFRNENNLKYSYHGADTMRVSELKTIPIKLRDDLDEARPKEEFEGNVRHWYGNSFFVWGIQSIKQNGKKGLDQTKRVFFINKVQVE
jgi:hypothetical protein